MCNNSLKAYLIYFYSLVFPVSAAFSNIILGLLIICSLLERNLKEKFKVIKNNKLVLIIYAIPLLLFISTILSSTASHGFFMNSGINNEYEFIIKHFIWLNFLFLILMTSKFDIQKVIKMFLIGIFFSETISYLVFFHIIDINYFKKIGLLYRHIAYNNPSPFMHHSFYSIYLAVSIILIFDNLSKLKGIFKIISMTFLFSATMNLFLNGGRIGQIAFFIGVILYVYKKYKNVKLFIFTIIVLSFVFMLAYKISPIFKTRANMAYNGITKVVLHKNYGSSWGRRIAADIAVLKIMLNNPKYILFGFGAGNAKKVFFEKGEKNASSEINFIKNFSHVHNQYFQLWIDGSILAFLLIFLFFYFLYRYNPSALTLSFIGIISFSFIADVIWYRPQTYILILFMSAILYKQGNK